MTTIPAPAPPVPPAPTRRPTRSARAVPLAVLAVALLATLFGPVGSPTAGAQSAVLGPLTLTPRSDGLTVGFYTNVPTRTIVQVAEAGAAWTPANIVRSVTDNRFQHRHVVSVGGLQSKRAYQVRVFAVTTTNRYHSRIQSFSTLGRTLEVHVDQIWVLDDSDSMGAGEITAHIRLNDHTRMYYYFDHSVSSGGILMANWSRTQTGVGPESLLKVQLIDDDAECSLAVPCDGLGSDHLHPNWGTGTNDFADWGTATLKIDSGTGAPTGKVPFWIQPQSHSRIKFAVVGWYRVTG